MENRNYRVLWIDDEHEKLGGFKLQAAQNGIQLNSFKSLKAGITELEGNLSLYDCVLLDAKFFETEDDETGSEDLSNLNSAKERLLQLPRKLDYFVLTGQAQLFEDKTFETFIPKYYRKGIAQDIDSLFVDIKDAADKQPETKIRHEYYRVFEVCTNEYIGSDSESILLEALKVIKDPDSLISTEDLFTPLRKIIEKLFAAFHRLGFIPDEIFNSNGKINRSSKFLAGNDQDYQLKMEILHPTISYTLRNNLLVIQDASHNDENLRLKVDEFVRLNSTPYLYKGVVFQLLDLLIWFKKFADQNSDLELNRACWTKLEPEDKNWVEGTVTRIASNGWGTFEAHFESISAGIMPHIVQQHGLKENQKISIVPRPSPDGRKTYIAEIKT